MSTYNQMHLADRTNLPLWLADWCHDILGAYMVVSTHTQIHQESQVWRLRTSNGLVYLKAHRRVEKWGLEVHAYEQWASALGDAVPRLIAVRDEPQCAILTTALSGTPLAQMSLTAEQVQAAYQAAGVTLARLHRLPTGQWFGAPRRNGQPQATLPEDDAVALIGTSLEYRLTRGVRQELLGNNEIALIKWALDTVEVFEGEQPTPCHGDYLPYNWIVDAAGQWQGLIDFEHARWDIRLTDLGIWWDRLFAKHPDHATAFLTGYGGCLSEREQTQLYLIRILCGVGNIIWGYEHGDPAAQALGHTQLGGLVTTEERAMQRKV